MTVAVFVHHAHLVVDDPNYFPLDNGTLYFFKVKGEHHAQRLIRLFDRHVKPRVEREDEKRLRVWFDYRRVDSFDDDDVLLFEEQLADTIGQVARLDREWEARPRQKWARKHGHLKRRPLEQEEFTSPWLHDRARRWLEKLVAESPGPVERGAANQAEEESRPIEPAEDDLLRLSLPSAVMASIGLRDLVRVRYYYPDAIPVDEARALHDGLAANLKSAVEICKLERIFEISTIPTFDEVGSELELGVMWGILAIWHPDAKGDPTSPDVAKNMDAALRICQKSVQEPVRSMVERVINAMLYDCRMPHPPDEPSFVEPQRFLQMLRKYWAVARQLILHHIHAPATIRPHPLIALILNLKSRMEVCFEKLTSLEGADDAQSVVNLLLESVMSGDPDDLTMMPDWSSDQVTSVDRFIAEARQRLGAKTYPVIPIEDWFLEHAKKAIDNYEASVKSEWSKYEKRLDAKYGKQAEASKADSTEPPSTEKEPSAETPAPTPFCGGEMVFFKGRVELSGVCIWKSKKPNKYRATLELLSGKIPTGEFRARDCQDIADLVGISQAVNVPGHIRHLRAKISNALKARSGIVCGEQDVITNVRGGPGYHFSPQITVRFADPPLFRDITDMGVAPNVRDDVREESVPEESVRDRAGHDRQAWILREMAKERRLKAGDVASHFRCSLRTAQRDLNELEAQGTIERVGPKSKTGYYRLLTSPVADDHADNRTT